MLFDKPKKGKNGKKRKKTERIQDMKKTGKKSLIYNRKLIWNT